MGAEAELTGSIRGLFYLTQNGVLISRQQQEALYHFLFSITAWKFATNSKPQKAKIFSFYSANFHSHFFSLPQLDPIYITMNSNKQSTRRRDIRTKEKKKTLKYKRMEELPPGYRFFPTEEELVSFYLINKLEGNRQELHRVIPVIRLYEIEPWHLPSTALILLLYLLIFHI